MSSDFVVGAQPGDRPAVVATRAKCTGSRARWHGPGLELGGGEAIQGHLFFNLRRTWLLGRAPWFALVGLRELRPHCAIITSASWKLSVSRFAHSGENRPRPIAAPQIPATFRLPSPFRRGRVALRGTARSTRAPSGQGPRLHTDYCQRIVNALPGNRVAT